MHYKVPFVDIKKHYQSIKKEINTTLIDVLKRGDLILRKDLQEFEKNIARFVGTTYAVGVNSGFDALHLSVKAAGIGNGDEVITVGHTFVATVAAIVHNGARPVLIDVADDYNMDVALIEKNITKQTKAIIPVHLNGRMCNMEAIQKIAQKYKLIIIEDAAQALGAQFLKKHAGAWGLTGCFSLYPFKLLGAFGDGGIVTTHNKIIAQKVRELRDHGQNRVAGTITMYGFNARLDNIQAALLNTKFKYFKRWLARRKKIAQTYYKGLKHITEITLPHFNDPRYVDVYQNYVITAEKRNSLKEFLTDNGVETLISWPKPMHHHKALQLSQFSLPKTEKVCKKVLSLPMNTEIEDSQIHYVIDTIKKFYD